MNLANELPITEKPVSTKNILKENGSATLIRIKKDEILAKHQSRANAVLVLLSGKVLYEEEQRKIELAQVHDFINIPGKVSHSVRGIEDSLLLLIQ